MANSPPNAASAEDQLYQALETEQGGIKVYETAITCALSEGLRAEWREHLDQTRHQEQVLLGIFKSIGLDPDARPPSRALVSGIGEALVASMRKARDTASVEHAEVVAWEAVVLADCRPRRFAAPTRMPPPPIETAGKGLNGPGLR